MAQRLGTALLDCVPITAVRDIGPHKPTEGKAVFDARARSGLEELEFQRIDQPLLSADFPGKLLAGRNHASNYKTVCRTYGRHNVVR
jgi:hypothetical protein